jgi:NAD(P)H-flavin reductase
MNAVPQIDPMTPRIFTVAARREETGDVFSFDFIPRDGGALPAFAPGQFNMLYLFGRGEVAISISGHARDRSRLTHTVRSIGSVTHGFEALAEGASIGVRGPFGTAWPMEEIKGRDILFLAGGLGLAPLRPAILHALSKRGDYGALTLLYGARSPDNLLFQGDLESWRAAPDIDLDITVDHANSDWQGAVGVITKLIARTNIDPARTVALICGPEIMMHFAVEALKKRGMDSAQAYVSLERNMKCAIGHCGHCQLGPEFVCRDGPVFRHDRVTPLLRVAGL